MHNKPLTVLPLLFLGQSLQHCFPFGTVAALLGRNVLHVAPLRFSIYIFIRAGGHRTPVDSLG